MSSYITNVTLCWSTEYQAFHQSPLMMVVEVNAYSICETQCASDNAPQEFRMPHTTTMEMLS